MTKVKYITVPQSIDGLDGIFGGWLVRMPCPEAPDKEFVVLVDVGTAAAAPDFLSALQKEGRKVLLGAADTFRAAAGEQLDIWANRVGCQIVKHV